MVDVDPNVVDTNGRPRQSFQGSNGPVTPNPASIIKEVVLRVSVQPTADRIDVYDELATHPAQRRWIGHILQANDPEDEDAVLFLDTAAPDDPADPPDRALDADGRAADPAPGRSADRRARRCHAQP